MLWQTKQASYNLSYIELVCLFVWGFSQRLAYEGRQLLICLITIYLYVYLRPFCFHQTFFLKVFTRHIYRLVNERIRSLYQNCHSNIISFIFASECPDIVFKVYICKKKKPNINFLINFPFTFLKWWQNGTTTSKLNVLIYCWLLY